MYLNPGNGGFKESLNSEIYVDKTGLIGYTNRRLKTRQKFLCVSRPRRFGKSMAADMLAAYYDRTCDSAELFKGLEISKDASFSEHLNKYDVIFINMQEFLSRSLNIDDLINRLTARVVKDLKRVYGEFVDPASEDDLSYALMDVYAETGTGFIFIIDEWDCIFREKREDKKAQNKYLDFLRNLLKDRQYISLAYMTGILPIKKYGTHSALNMFEEISMTDPGRCAEYMGFTADEVRALCDKYDMDYSETQRWYDGYLLKGAGHIYNPKSIVDAMQNGNFRNYWTRTETYEALKVYIDLDFDGLRSEIVSMLAGARYGINTMRFTNDMTTFENKDDVLTLLIHLGYLGYDSEKKEAFIPNEEIGQEFVNAMTASKWEPVINSLKNSDKMLDALLAGDSKTVADGIESVHSENTSILTYNDENSLSCVISLAFYSARNSYIMVREMPTGKGFADIVFIPRKNINKPAIVAELKWDKTAEGAIAQINERNYCDSLKAYAGDVILAGINYDKTTKEHSCIIEKTEKGQ